MNKCAYSLLILVPMVLNGQVVRRRDVAPLKPWPAPLYWQPAQAEAHAIAAQPDAGSPAPQASVITQNRPYIIT